MMLSLCYQPSVLELTKWPANLELVYVVQNVMVSDSVWFLMMKKAAVSHRY